MERLLELIRERIRGRMMWDQAVEIVEAGAVGGIESMEDEIVLAVAMDGRVLEVSLYPLDDEWDCQCDTRAPICTHVVAAAVAVQKAREAGQDLPPPPSRMPEPDLDPEPEPEPEPAPIARSARPRPTPRRVAPRPPKKPAFSGVGRLRYLLERRHPGLALSRLLVFDNTERSVDAPLAQLAARRTFEITVEPHDEIVDALVEGRLSYLVPRQDLEALFEALSACGDVQLDGAPVEIDPEPLGRWALVEKRGERFRLSLTSDPPIDEELGQEIVRCGAQLRLLGATGLDHVELDRVASGQSFGPDDVQRLVVQVLPDLRDRIEVEVRADDLPKVVLSEPRVIVETQREGDALTVEATIVYGDPIIAQIKRNRLIMTGDGQSVPIREPEEEREAAIEVGQQLQLVPGKPQKFVGPRAKRFADRLAAWDGEVVGDAHLAFGADA